MTIPLRLHVVVAALLFSAVPVLAQPPPRRADARPQDPPRPFAWWKSEPFKKELGLTADQSTRIDKIWETTRPELRQEWDELSKLEAKLSRLIQVDADEAVLTRQIDRVETARANANKTRSLMLVQMLKVLTPDQRTRFNALHTKWQQEQPQTETPARRAASSGPLIAEPALALTKELLVMKRNVLVSDAPLRGTRVRSSPRRRRNRSPTTMSRISFAPPRNGSASHRQAPDRPSRPQPAGAADGTSNSAAHRWTTR